MNLFLALLVGDSPKNPTPDLRPIDPVVEMPWTLSMWLMVLGGVLLVLILIVWAVFLLSKKKPVTRKPGARRIALDALRELSVRSSRLSPYDFSIAVSDILRAFVSRHFSVRATQQTSPEFLASISSHSGFSQTDRQLLASFLERCDLIKFSKDTGSEQDIAGLLKAAESFVQGERE